MWNLSGRVAEALHLVEPPGRRIAFQDEDPARAARPNLIAGRGSSAGTSRLPAYPSKLDSASSMEGKYCMMFRKPE